jgi:ribosomal protein S27E
MAGRIIIPVADEPLRRRRRSSRKAKPSPSSENPLVPAPTLKVRCPSCAYAWTIPVSGADLQDSPGAENQQFRTTCPNCAWTLTVPGGTMMHVSGVAAEVQETVERLLPQVQASGSVAPPSDTVWISGSFYLLLAIVALVGALAIIHFAPGWLVLPTAAIAILLFVIVGTVVLRHNEKLSEKGLLTIIRETSKRVWSLHTLLKDPNRPR